MLQTGLLHLRLLHVSELSARQQLSMQGYKARVTQVVLDLGQPLEMTPVASAARSSLAIYKPTQ